MARCRKVSLQAVAFGLLALVLGAYVSVCLSRSEGTGDPRVRPRQLGQPSGLPLPGRLSIAQFETKLFDFLNTRQYTKRGWLRDKGVRDTGPYVEGKYYGTHPAVRVYYSPGVVRWLIDGRAGKIRDGEM